MQISEVLTNVMQQSDILEKEQPSNNKSKPRILVVENDPEIQRYAQSTLQFLNCEAIFVKNAIEAINNYRDNIQLVLVDINLRGLPGFYVSIYIRSHETSTQHIPIIGHTRFINDEIKRCCRMTGMDTVIEKLHTVEAFKTLLQQWLPNIS